MKSKLFCVLFFCLFSNLTIFGQAPNKESSKMKWFEDAKFGIFIHWGIYAVDGISESWAFYNNYISHEDYLKQLNGFTATNYHPENWVKLIEESGAKYTVITAKHHDGVALWDSKVPGALTTIKDAAAKQDLLTPFIKAVEKSGLKKGVYFSLPDWSDDNYDIKTRFRKRYALAENPEKWTAFKAYMQQQLQEISRLYHPDLIWFDGDWEHSAQEWASDDIASLIKKENNDVIVNSRLPKYGDYATPEQGLPIIRPKDRHWELCYTMNDAWGYQPFDRHYKTTHMLIRTLVDCISMGGNLLLDIAPKADGSIPAEQVAILKGIGRWTKKHAEAIYQTKESPKGLVFQGKTAQSQDGKTMYVYLNGAQKQAIWLQGVKSIVKKAYVVGNPQKNIVLEQHDLDLSVQIPESSFDQDVTVLALVFDEPVQTSPIATSAQRLEAIIKKPLDDKKIFSSRISAIAYAVSEGQNPFNQTNLSIDGEGFSAKVKDMTLDSTTYKWIKKNAPALYHTKQALPSGYYSGYSALSEDSTTLFLFVEGKPTGPISIKGINNKVYRTWIVGEGSMLPHEVFDKLYWNETPGIVYVDLPKDRLDDEMTVIALLLDGPLSVYRQPIKPLEN